MFSNNPGLGSWPPQSSPAHAGSRPADDIYIMPERFHARQHQSSNKTLLIAAAVLFLTAAAAAAYFGYEFWRGYQPTLISQNQPVVNNQLANNISAPVIPDAESASPPELPPESTSTPDTLTAASSTPDNLTPPPLVIPVKSSDTDQDGLTDVEEGAVGTSASKPDTDSDGYLDGEEIINGYNPLIKAAGDAGKLLAADYITAVTTSFIKDNFRVLSFKAWPVNIVEAVKQVFITTNTGEIIKISVKDNPQWLSPANWYLENNPRATANDLGLLAAVKAGELSGVFSRDGLAAYLSDDQRTKMYIFEYLKDNETEFRYPAIFTMIIRSLRPISVANPNPPLASSTDDLVSPVLP